MLRDGYMAAPPTITVVSLGAAFAAGVAAMSLSSPIAQPPIANAQPPAAAAATN